MTLPCHYHYILNYQFCIWESFNMEIWLIEFSVCGWYKNVSFNDGSLVKLEQKKAIYIDPLCYRHCGRNFLYIFLFNLHNSLVQWQLFFSFQNWDERNRVSRAIQIVSGRTICKFPNSVFLLSCKTCIQLCDHNIDWMEMNFSSFRYFS